MNAAASFLKYHSGPNEKRARGLQQIISDRKAKAELLSGKSESEEWEKANWLEMPKFKNAKTEDEEKR